MSKFILHRVERLEQEPAQERITPGLKAAACLHRITCHEREPDKFAAVGPELPALRRQLADYLEATARETAAYLALKSAQQAEQCEAGPEPAKIGWVHGQFGWNWLLLYWDEVSAGGKPWGYRVYRREALNAPVLVATVLETEALLPDQPEGLHFYYHVTAFNATGESEASPTFGLMLNAPDEEETNTGSLHFPAHEMPIRRELGAAMMAFVQKTMQFIFANDEEDTVMRHGCDGGISAGGAQGGPPEYRSVARVAHTDRHAYQQPARELLIRFDGGHKARGRRKGKSKGKLTVAP